MAEQSIIDLNKFSPETFSVSPERLKPTSPETPKFTEDKTPDDTLAADSAALNSDSILKSTMNISDNLKPVVAGSIVSAQELENKYLDLNQQKK